MSHDDQYGPEEDHLRDVLFESVELADTLDTWRQKCNALGLELDSLDHATKIYVDGEINDLRDELYREGVMHYASVYSAGESAVNGGPPAAAVNMAKAVLGDTVKDNDAVMLKYNQRYSYSWGNGTAYSNRPGFAIYIVTDAETDLWTLNIYWIP